MIDSITSILGLKDDEVESCVEAVKNSTHHFHLTLINRGGRCPSCSTFTKSVKEYRMKQIRHAVLLNEAAVIHYRARRFACPKCGTTFFEGNPFDSGYQNISDKTVTNVLKELKKYNTTFSSVARTTGISTNEVMKIFDEHVQPPRIRLSPCIGIDEFYFSRYAKHKYALMILSLDKGYICDLLPSREKSRLISYFRSIPLQERDQVRFISIDMSDNYRDVVKLCFHNAVLCADPFHVLKMISDSLDKVRLKVLHQYDNDKKSDEYYLLKYQKQLLYSDVETGEYHEVKKNHHFKYTVTDDEKREMLLSVSEDLKKAYHLKENYDRFNNRKDLSIQERETYLDDLINQFLISDVAEMISAGLTLKNWRNEILNSFNTIQKKRAAPNNQIRTDTVRVTSGPVEGRNKYIKIILKLANGYSNFDRFRNRALFVLNKSTPYSEEKLQKRVQKITGPKPKK